MTQLSRRALVILRRELIDSQHEMYMTTPAIMSLPSARVAATVAEMIPNFCLFALQEEGAIATLQFKLNELITRPQEFLARHEILTQSANNLTGIGTTPGSAACGAS